jgi:hypothetical protein
LTPLKKTPKNARKTRHSYDEDTYTLILVPQPLAERRPRWAERSARSFSRALCDRFEVAYDLLIRPTRLSKSPGSTPNASAICPSTVTLADTSPRSMAPT